MIPEFRKKFNAAFTEAGYRAFVADVNSATSYPADFRLSETPLFLTDELTGELVRGAGDICSALSTPAFRGHAERAIPEGLAVPGEDGHPVFLQIDFALCRTAGGLILPQLIELQGFPSLYCFQHLLDEKMRAHFSIPPDFTSYFNGLDPGSYVKLLRETVIGTAAAENVVLLEIQPELQKTRIDFACTRDLLGIEAVCVSDIIRRGAKLFYRRGGREIPIERIYNRVIFDELEKKKPPMTFRFGDELDVHWVGHPNWYFRISKHSLPFIRSGYSPPSFFLHALDRYPHDLEHYVLKPLYSFAGSGVKVHVTRELLDAIPDKQNYILQRRVEYAPLVETPDGFSKCEIRMMFIWNDGPLLVNNLVRMSKGEMMGVAFNKEKTWVGSSLAYHR